MAFDTYSDCAGSRMPLLGVGWHRWCERCGLSLSQGSLMRVCVGARLRSADGPEDDAEVGRRRAKPRERGACHERHKRPPAEAQLCEEASRPSETPWPILSHQKAIG